MAAGAAASETLDLLGALPCAPSSEFCVDDQVPMMGAQFTIFYSGRVNIYENVPPDKANAIMLLLANGGRGGDPSLTDERKNATGGGGSSRASPPSSSLPILTSFMTSSQARFMKQPRHLVIQRSQDELPVARKASLARFLEKRADR